MIECEPGGSRLQVMMNGVIAKSVRLRFCPGVGGHLDVMAEHSELGRFALHGEFDLLMREDYSDWRPVHLDELRSILIAQRESSKLENQAHDKDVVDLTPRQALSELAAKPVRLVRVGEVIGLDASVQRVEAAFYRESIPHLRAGATFVIPSALRARTTLIRAGFCQHPDYESVVVDPQSGMAIRLLERDPRALQPE